MLRSKYIAKIVKQGYNIFYWQMTSPPFSSINTLFTVHVNEILFLDLLSVHKQKCAVNKMHTEN